MPYIADVPLLTELAGDPLKAGAIGEWWPYIAFLDSDTLISSASHSVVIAT